MGMREKIEERIRRKEQEIQEHQALVREAKAYIQAMQEAIKLLPREDTKSATAEITLRPGSSAYKAMVALKAADRPLHIVEILKAIGMPLSKNNRVSLGGTLSRYARNKEIFTRTGPNIFSLISKDEEEPPDDFGVLSEEREDEVEEESSNSVD